MIKSKKGRWAARLRPSANAFISCHGVQLSECDRKSCDKFVDKPNPFCNARVRKLKAPWRPAPKHIIEEQFRDRAQVLRSALRCGLAGRLVHLVQIDLIDMSKEAGGLIKYIQLARHWFVVQRPRSTERTVVRYWSCMVAA
jgi:hypothetical protein